MKIVIYKMKKSNALLQFHYSWPDESTKDERGKHTGGYLMLSEKEYNAIKETPELEILYSIQMLM